jgi:hypothetical protein
MIDKIMLSQDRKQIVIYYTDRPNFGLYHSEAKVLDLLAWFLTPINSTCYDITWNGYMSSQEDTAVINLEDLERKVA